MLYFVLFISWMLLGWLTVVTKNKVNNFLKSNPTQSKRTLFLLGESLLLMGWIGQFFFEVITSYQVTYLPGTFLLASFATIIIAIFGPFDDMTKLDPPEVG